MRPLNRPMFRYGGPIKEGIMQGMKEPQAINTVGSPLAPTDASGRQGYALPLMFLLGQGARMALRPLGTFAMRNVFGKPITTTGAGGAKTIASNITGQSLKFNPTGLGKYFLQSPEAGAIRAVASGSGTIGSAVKKVGTGLAKSPLTVGSLGYMGFKALGPDEQPLEVKEEGTGIKRGDPNKDKTVPTPEVTGDVKNVKSDTEKQQINEDRINETKQKYYKLMGIDKMNKDAVYDSLIDASRIVSEEGADLKGSIKSGALQNRLIQAIGKNLDKSADLKKAIDSAVLKGEIQKDINLTKPSAFAEQVEYIRNNPDDPLAKKLSGMTSVADNIASIVAEGKTLTSDTVGRLVGAKGTDIKDIVKDDKYQKWEKNNENKDEIDYLQEITKGASLDAGIYIVNKKAIRIDEEGNAFPIDLDSIIG